MMQTICLLMLFLGLPGCGGYNSLHYHGLEVRLSPTTENYKQEELDRTVDNVYEKFADFYHLEKSEFLKYINNTVATAEDCYCFESVSYQPITSIDKCRKGIDHRSLIWLDEKKIKLAILYKEGSAISWLSNLLTHELGHLILDRLGVPTTQHDEYMELIGLE